jgi:peptide-methionine (S)-S-oxide reductase
MQRRLPPALAFVLLAAAGLAGPMSGQEGGSPAKATFAGGCFWCMEPPFDALDGVISTTSGYTGGHVPSPTYQQVSAGGTGHAEAVEVLYDPARVSYEALLDVFWHNIDPTTADAQFCDHGDQYRSAVFVHDKEQRRLAEASKEAIAASGVLTEPIVTEIVDAATFYPAEDYHQDYYLKNPLRYKLYRAGCARDRTLERIWGDDAPAH